MPRLLFLLLFATVSAPAAAFADCFEKKQDLSLGQDTPASIKIYLCSVGGDGGQLKVEFYQLSSVAAGMVLGQSPKTTSLSSLLGPYRLIENQVSRAYADLFGDFSQTVAIGGGGDGMNIYTSLPREGPDSWPVTDQLEGSKVRTILLNPSDNMSYPLTQELAYLGQKTLPPGSKFYYWGSCYEDTPGIFECPQKEMLIWRSMTIADLINFRDSLATEKRTVASQGIQTSMVADPDPADDVETYLKLVWAVAGEKWPEDFLTLKLYHADEGCHTGDHWSFQFAPRDMALRVALITNESRIPIEVDAVLGSLVDSADLRVSEPGWSPSLGSEPIAISPSTLRQRESLLVPIQIRFPPPEKPFYEEDETSDVLFRLLGSQGLKVRADDYQIPPPPRPYVYGPEIRLAGLRANGARVQLAPRSANFVEMIASYEEGSCPYLLVWDETGREWVNHGKVLHKARGERRKETEAVSFSGFESRFRFAEREPEVTILDQIALEVTLRDGATRTLKAQQDALTHVDNNAVQLFWGDVVDVVFGLPEGVAENEIVQSRLLVTGFYHRYEEIRAATAQPLLKMCPAPEPTAVP